MDALYDALIEWAPNIAHSKRFFNSVTNILPTAPPTPRRLSPHPPWLSATSLLPFPPARRRTKLYVTRVQTYEWIILTRYLALSPGSSPTNTNEPAEVAPDPPAPATPADPAAVVEFLAALAAPRRLSQSHFNLFSSILRTRSHPCCPGAYAAPASAADVAAVVAFLLALAALAPAAQTGENLEPAAAASSPPSKKAKKESRGKCPRPGCGGLSHEGKCIPYCMEGQKRTTGQMPEGGLWWALPRGGVYPLL
ncbi:uncharacterized protein APUU_61077A [Aspergillus puulaauensis]|uniref:Uncharacterized protein n=1 Tax=Aspergillus puulaauensis TaxID=1220207 RepID=A0A7R8AQB2_9EURO|nr:uncharacterized protein APUU_61077A [Aspergillus puulaauensis]BCS28029.1 hypothetical protein APUU_61077A [Aspergillus puulaauensis]